MMTRATLRFSNRSYVFAVLSLPDGIPTRPQLVTEELSGDGIDGVMTVNNRYAFFPFRVSGLISMATMAAAQDTADDLMGLRGIFAQSFETDVLGRRVSFQHIQLQDISARPQRDIGGGPFAVSGQGAVVAVSMVLRPTQRGQ